MTDVPPPKAEPRTLGEYSLDALESFLLDATHPLQDTARGAYGFQIIEAKELAATLRKAMASGQMTLGDLVGADGEELGRADGEELGRLVREVWVEWAQEQPDAKASWLVPWEGLAERDREVDRRIGERVASAAIAALSAPSEPWNADERWVAEQALMDFAEEDEERAANQEHSGDAAGAAECRRQGAIARGLIARLRAEMDRRKAEPPPDTCALCGMVEDLLHHKDSSFKGYHPFEPALQEGDHR